MKRTSASSSPIIKRQKLEEDYRRCVTETWLSLGKCANTLGIIKSSIISFEHAVSHDPSNIDALCGLSSSLRLNDIHLNETVGSQNSIQTLNRALEMWPILQKNFRIFKELAECYLLIGLNEEGHQSIQTAIQLCPQDASLWLLSAQTLIRAGARPHAANALARCLSILPESLAAFSKDDIELARAAHAELAAIAAADGNIDVSITELTATLSLPPPPLARADEHVALWCALATAKERANDIAGALEACRAAETSVGPNPRILLTHAYLLLIDGTPGHAHAAVDLLNQIVDRNGEEDTDDSNRDFLPWYLLGKAYSILGSPRAAYDSYQVALRRASTSPITWLAVGKLYLELKQLPDALASYSQALRLQMDETSPGTATAWDGLSCVYERCDDQLMDASDACLRSAACFRAIGDMKNAQLFDDRAHQLSLSSKKEAAVPALRDPPDVPNFLLRDLVALMPAERIAFVQAQPAQPAAQQPPLGPPAPAPAPAQAPAQPAPPPAHTPAPAQSPLGPLGPLGLAPLHSPNLERTPQQLYPLPYKAQWSPGHPVPPQYMYQGPAPHYGAPPNGSMLPPPPGPPGPHRSPMDPQVMPNGYPLGPPPPPPGFSYGQYVPMQVMPYGGPNWRR